MTNSAPIFAALGDRTRLQLVARLCGGEPLSITQLSAGSPVTRQAITKHLHVLAGVGLVHGFRQGREQLWELKHEQLEQARRYLDQISRQWDEALSRLQAVIEGETR
ncbi:MAG TPA: metalloregulator ArsR/SmtB family transcription factor [Bryobacteraceae bacterium]|nr:metalloregulator ArsR/SmtB family transcription factor [Bryobacteraceae bacterium]